MKRHLSYVERQGWMVNIIYYYKRRIIAKQYLHIMFISYQKLKPTILILWHNFRNK